MIVALQIFLLVACFVILAFQLVLLRQIGLIHGRLRTLDDPNEKPGKTEIKRFRMLDGSDWVLSESPATFCILLSTTCHHCKPILERLSEEIFKPEVLLGLGAGSEDSALEVCNKLDLSPRKVFWVRDLRDDLNLNEFPGYVILDGNGNILSRRSIFAWKHLENALTEHKTAGKGLPINN